MLSVIKNVAKRASIPRNIIKHTSISRNITKIVRSVPDVRFVPIIGSKTSLAVKSVPIIKSRGILFTAEELSIIATAPKNIKLVKNDVLFWVFVIIIIAACAPSPCYCRSYGCNRCYRR